MAYKKFFSGLCCLVGTIILTACGSSKMPPTNPINSQVSAANILLEPWNTFDEPGVAVAVRHNGQLIFSSEGGRSNLEYNALISQNTIFQVASVSKQFTAFSILLLVSEGKIALDSEISNYLPKMKNTGGGITIQHLLDHMGGLRELSSLTGMAGWLPDDIRTNAQLLGLLSSQKGRNFEPRATVEYSNSGYFLLSKIVEHVSGLTFSEFTQDRIFTPLQMKHTEFYDDRSKVVPERAMSYVPAQNGFRHNIYNSEKSGSSGLITTPQDLLKWADNFEVQTVGDSTVFELMATRTHADDGSPSTFGRGQELRYYKGLKTWSHGGREAAYRSFLLRVPDENFSLSVLSNRADFDTAKIAYALTDIFLGESENFINSALPGWTPATEVQLAKYLGEYELYPGLIFTISTKDGSLYFAAQGSENKTRVPQIAKHAFMLNPSTDTSIVFNFGTNGHVAAFDYTIGLHGTIPAKRVKLLPFDAKDINVAEFEGLYQSQEVFSEYTFKAEGEQLVALHPRLAPIYLTPYQQDTFRSSGPLGKIEFDRDKDDHVIGFHAYSPLVEGVIFKRQ